ncbi:Kinase, Uni1 [Spironucleus salmonicida]|uniref:Kinase, Uni1 n=1 Tax=Spironucleus salmonicida TaxID=348837 RepID=V6LDE2_9EUKA|nr:Kinase, Uni1 [Spironucleus salmonicida]|eukprot:EST42530.1 Kinase, Uni1 [Spironucleus salmonicida]
MEFDKTIKLLKQKRDDNKDQLSYNQIYSQLQKVTCPDQILNFLKALLKMFQQNIEREQFFNLNFPVIIFKLGLLKYEDEKIFQICAVLLRKIMSETSESCKKVEDQILKYLHKSRYNETLQFYILIGNICTSPTSSETILHSAIPNLLVKFYHSKISTQCKNTQLFESLDLVTMKNRLDESDSESQKSGATMLSSLSLDEDIAYKRNDNNGEPLSARSILSDFGNTLLDDDQDLKKQADVETFSDRDKDFDNQSVHKDRQGEVSQLSREDDMSNMEDQMSMGQYNRESQESVHMTTDTIEELAPDNLGHNKSVSQLKKLPQKVVMKKDKVPVEQQSQQEEPSRNSQDFSDQEEFSRQDSGNQDQDKKYLENEIDNHSQHEQDSKYSAHKQQNTVFNKNNANQDVEADTREQTPVQEAVFHDQFNSSVDMTKELDNRRKHQDKQQRVVLAIAGPLSQAIYNKPKPKIIPLLNLKLLQEAPLQLDQTRFIEPEHYANPLASPTRLLISPMAKSKKNNEDIDQTFKKQLEFINQQRKGSIILNEIGNLIGQFTAMSDYPLISSIIKNTNQQTVIFPEQQNAAEIYIQKYFTDLNSREVFDYDFSFSMLHKIMNQQDNFDVLDIQRLGILYILHVLIKNSPQLTVQILPSTHVMFTYDMIQLRSQKQGFLPASLLALHTIVADITQAKLVLQMDLWNQALTQMHTHVSNDYEFINVFNEKLTTFDDPEAYERRNINLPSLVFLLERLEGTRRKMVLELRILATKLRDLCLFHKNLSAVEDLPHVIGSIVDLLECSQGSKFIRAAAMELLLPSIMKLIELILTKKIKSRQFYVFISHKVIQLISILMKTSNSARDLQQANIDQVFLKIFVFKGLEVVPWLRRYAYLMLVNSRVRLELSGLFINQKQCDTTFSIIRISFAQFVANLAKLIYNLFFQFFNQAEDGKVVNLNDITVPQEANLLENNFPQGDDSKFDLNSKMLHLPVHQLCESIINGDKLYNLKNENQFQTQHNIVKEKFCCTGMGVDFTDFLFLIDYDTGVLMQFVMLHQATVLEKDNERDVYYNCLVAIKNLIAIPTFLNIIPKHQVNKHLIFHYLSFLKFYNQSLEFMNKKFKVSSFQLAEVHLQVLIEFANSNDAAIRQHILIIKIIDFLAQQIQYESLTEAERASNKQQRTSLLPTYRANIGDSTNSDLDFGMDSDIEDKKAEEKPALTQLSLNFLSIPAQGKEIPTEDTKPKISLQLPQKLQLLGTDGSKDSGLLMNLPSLAEKGKITSKLNLKLPNFSLTSDKQNTKSVDEQSSFQNSDTQPKMSPFKMTLALPGQSSDKTEDPVVYSNLKNNQLNDDIESDSDGWGDTATRLNIDIGQKDSKEYSPQQVTNFDDFSDSDDIPLSQPIKKMGFNINLNLGSVAPKESEKVVVPTIVLQQADLNLKMHLVLAKQSGRQNLGKEVVVQEEVLDEKDVSNKSDSFEFEELVKVDNKDINDLDQETEVPLIPIYYDDSLHFTVIKFILILITNPKTGGLDCNYVTQFPSNNGMVNIPVILHNHLNNDRNTKIVKQLIKEQFGMSQRRLLRLLCFSQFNSEYYDTTKYKLLAKGAYGEVYSGNVNITKNERQQKNAVPVAVKLQKLSNGLHERCVLHDLFQEITVLENIQSDPNFCQLYDYGVTPQGYIIIMQRYYTSFKNFREQLFAHSDQKLRYQNPKKMIEYGHETSMMTYIRLLLLTYLKFIEQLDLLHQKYYTIHFDLKCDNIFINPASFKWLTMKSTPDLNNNGIFQHEIMTKHLKAKLTSQLPYNLQIADFGESHMFSCQEDENSMLSKGTEFNKSPEMLVATNQQFAKSFNRRRQKGAGKPSDIWSAACTLFEILTNDYLFYDNDWIRFFLRITSQQSQTAEYGKDSFTFSNVPHFAQLVRGVKLSPEKQAMLGNCRPIIDLLEFQLVQDPTKRPSISQIKQMVNHVLTVYFPSQYQFNAEKYASSKKPEPAHPGNAFNPNAWQYSLMAAQQDLMGNPNEILAPKVSIICKDDKITGTKLTQAKPLSLAYASDLLLNNQILLGGLKDVQNAKYMNTTNVSTVIDCTIQQVDARITTISHVYRPSVKLFKIYKGQDIDKLSFKDFIISLEEVFDVVRCALVKNAAVMIVDETGFNFSSCIAVACLMEFEDLYLYQAVIYLKRIRPAVLLQQKFLDFLQIWHDNRTKIGVKMMSMFSSQTINKQINLEAPENYQLATQRVAEANYRCMCGKVFFVQKMFTSTSYVLCNCVASKPYNYTVSVNNQAISCPSTSCRTLQNYFVSLYGLNTPKMLYCYGKNEDFISNWPRATMLTDAVPNFEQAENAQIQFRGVDNMRAPLYRMQKKDGWSLFICKICGSPTHFIKVDQKEQDRQIAVICNISNK